MIDSDTLALLRDAHDLLADHPLAGLRRSRRMARAALAARIGARLAALAHAVSDHPAVAATRARWEDAEDVEIDIGETEISEGTDGYWVRAWVLVPTEILPVNAQRAARPDPALYRAIVMALPPATRDIFLMHRVDGLDYATIAKRLSISIDAVERGITDALVRLDHRLDDPPCG